MFPDTDSTFMLVASTKPAVCECMVMYEPESRFWNGMEYSTLFCCPLKHVVVALDSLEKLGD